jgi:hypothetical protein
MVAFSLVVVLSLVTIAVKVTVAEVAPAGMVTWLGDPLKVYCFPKTALPFIE